MNMYFCKFIYFFILLYSGNDASYIYPLWTLEEQKSEKNADSHDKDATITEFLIDNILFPTKDLFCNVCDNFLEVYTCIVQKLEADEDQELNNSLSYFQKILCFLGLRENVLTTRQTCSYYAILVVTISIISFLGLIFVDRKDRSPCYHCYHSKE
ncbi:hypothetical protein ABEB36_001596 [Hypothenemus hampei]|uniref:Uncharacterized protein n=1 Tax=Hypothenemus hampei TaxID=57062 RepID=A0ABD1FF25_HYPHA